MQVNVYEMMISISLEKQLKSVRFVVAILLPNCDLLCGWIN